MFWKRAFDGLCGLLTFTSFGWNIIVVSIIDLGLFQTHCKQVSDFSRPSESDLMTWASFGQSLMPLHFLEVKAGSEFLPSGQYGLCFGYCFSGLLPLRSHKVQVTLLKPFPGVPSHLDYTQKLAKSTLALKLSVTTYFHHLCQTLRRPKNPGCRGCATQNLPP